jgi:hypothetical protein
VKKLETDPGLIIFKFIYSNLQDVLNRIRHNYRADFRYTVPASAPVFSLYDSYICYFFCILRVEKVRTWIPAKDKHVQNVYLSGLETLVYSALKDSCLNPNRTPTL